MTAVADAPTPAPTKTKVEKKDYVVLSPQAPYEVVHKGKYLSREAAFEAALERVEVGDGKTVSYIVVAAKFFKPLTVKAEVKRKLVFS